MIADRTTTLWSLVFSGWHRVIGTLLLVGAVEVANDYVDLQRASFSIAATGLLVTALSIFLVFRVNEAYARWWEARTLWGGLLNYSRTFARQATSWITASVPTDTLVRELVYRQIAYVNALRLTLRGEEDWEQLEPFLAADELSALQGKASKPTALLQTQAAELARLRTAQRLDGYGHWQLDSTLTQLTDLQGGCERIKRTVFPDSVAYFTRFSAWTIAVFIPIALLDPANSLDLIDIVVVPMMMLVFLITERLGAELKNPFEGLPNDTPMSAICRSIEIDLRQQLGEVDVPEPLEAVGGVLM